jgi:hypothetical protein
MANARANSFFILEGTPMSNVRHAPNPLIITLPNGEKVRSTKICDISIPGQPVMLTGHIIPGLFMALLMEICILCKAGCIVIFTDTTCEMIYNNKFILTGFKDPTTNLWMLLITPTAIIETSCALLARPVVAHTAACPLLRKDLINQKNPDRSECAGFIHLIWMQSNSVKISHQSLCNPSLLKAIRKGFLKGCPNLNEELVTKYLNPSPTTAKGHTNRPRMGIRSTGTKSTKKGDPTNGSPVHEPVPQLIPPVLPIFVEPLP